MAQVMLHWFQRLLLLLFGLVLSWAHHLRLFPVTVNTLTLSYKEELRGDTKQDSVAWKQASTALSDWGFFRVQPVEADKKLSKVASTFITAAGDNMSQRTYIMAAESHSLGWIQLNLLLVFYMVNICPFWAGYYKQLLQPSLRWDWLYPESSI